MNKEFENFKKEKIKYLLKISTGSNRYSDFGIETTIDAILDKAFKMGNPDYNKEKAQKLWAELGDIPINEYEEIDTDWNDFKKGTHIQDIWHWFEEKFDVSVARDLMKLL